jgi:hypothetical protein
MFKRFELGIAGTVAATLVALVLVPSASAGKYPDASDDASMGGVDLSGVTVTSDKNGQVVFGINVNLAAPELHRVWLEIDSDANPLTGDLTSSGTDFYFEVSPRNRTYSLNRWNGSDWVDTPDTTVRVFGGLTQLTVSVNRTELDNSSVFNFSVTTVAISTSGAYTFIGFDHAPDDGMFNYSFDANGPQIDSVDVQTKPSIGPRAGKKFVVTPTGLHLPGDGRTNTALPTPESYACTAQLGPRALAGSGAGHCTFSIPKKKAKGKRLTVQLTVNYEGATKTVPLTFRVA